MNPLLARFGRIFRTSLFIIPFGVLGNLAFSLLATDRKTLASLASFPRGYLALAVGLALVPWLTNTLRLMIWTRFVGCALAARDAFRIVLAGELGSAVTPTSSGGGFFRWGMLVQRGITPGAAASLTTLTVLEDTLFFALALPVALGVTRAWELPVLRQVGRQVRDNAAEVVLGAALLGALVWLAGYALRAGWLGVRVKQWSWRRLGEARRRLRGAWRDAVGVYGLIAQRGKRLFALSLFLTGVQWTARYSVVSALVAFLGAPVDPVLFFLLQWVIFTLMGFVPTPGAAGGAEAAFYLIYAPLLPARVIGLATAGWRFLTFYLLLGIGAVLFALLNLRERRASGAPAPARGTDTRDRISA